MNQDLNALHRRLCPKKSLGNFYRSVDYKAAREACGQEPIKVQASKGNPAQTLAHPLIALAFMRWADAPHFYARLQRVLDS